VRLVVIARLQPKGGVLEGVEQLTELWANEQAQRFSSSRYRRAYMVSTSSGISIRVS
jgi:hypothetical protein